MPLVPTDTRFVGIGTTVNLTERKSSLINAETQPYTMQDISDTIANSSGNSIVLRMEWVGSLSSTLYYSGHDGSIVVDYVSPGVYTVYGTTPFAPQEVVPFVGQAGQTYTYAQYNSSEDKVYVYCFNGTSFVNNLNVYLEIKLFN